MVLIIAEHSEHENVFYFVSKAGKVHGILREILNGKFQSMKPMGENRESYHTVSVVVGFVRRIRRKKSR